MKFQNVIIVALFFTLYLILVNIMFDMGIFDSVSNKIRIVKEYEYGGMFSMLIDSSRFFMLIPFNICYIVFYTAFLWMLTRFSNKVVGDISFVIWCVMLVAFFMIDFLRSFYVVFNFSGEVFLDGNWEENNIFGNFLLFSTQNSNLFLIRKIIIVIFNLMLLATFVYMWNKDKLISITGFVLVIINLIGLLPIPYLYLINLGWVMLFVITLVRIKNLSDF